MPRSLPESTDVLVVGAGPVGLTLATALARRGVDAVLVHRAAEGANTSRAAVVHARTMEVLRCIDVTEKLIDRGVIVPRITIRERDRELLSVHFDALPTDYPFVLLVPQNITEEVLLAQLRASGGDVLRPYELDRLTQERDGVTAHLATGERIRASRRASRSAATRTPSRSCWPTCTSTGPSRTTR
jgi:2-polyprenyl-6-methoxyphenol hydroxylase-like FAD-dependent oxidoreductase